MKKAGKQEKKAALIPAFLLSLFLFSPPTAPITRRMGNLLNPPTSPFFQANYRTNSNSP
jgi:hypothetical protein